MHIEAIIIRKRPIREYDQLVVLYSRELGKVSALAKGSLRSSSRQALALDEGSRVLCELVDGRTSPIMTGTQAIQSLGHAKQDARAWAAAQVFLQVIDATVFDAQSDYDLWECLTQILEELDSVSRADILDVYRRGQERLLRVLGYGVQDTTLSRRWSRTALDEQLEIIAQRRLSSIDLLYDVAALSLT